MDFYDSQQALGFLISQASNIEAQAYEIQYPDIQYPNLIPVETAGNAWAKSVTFFSTDKVGKAEWFNHLAKDVPNADVERAKHEHPLELAAIGYFYTLEELGQAQMIPGTNLTSDRAAAAVRAYEEFLDRVALYGDAAKGWSGLVNDGNVTAVNAQAGQGGDTEWSAKTADEILRDVNDALTGVYTESLTVEMANTIALPVAAMALISTLRIPDTSMTVLTFLRENNVYTQITGAPLTIRALRGLETAAPGDEGRMIAYRRDPQVLKFHLPMPHRFLPPRETGALRFDVPGIFRTGGTEIRRPGAVRYVDGIWSEAT